jgi:very-short-patch-repair endonuclease
MIEIWRTERGQQDCSVKISDEHRKKISESMKKAHAAGKAHNIGSSRWNNTPSYPEKFFAKVIANEFEDKNFVQEYPFGRYSLDFAWVHLKKVIEIDGDQHERFEKQKESDARKDKALEDAGWQVLRVKWKEMYSDTKAQIANCKQFLKL